MKKLLAVLLLSVSFFAAASGDKNQYQNPVFNDDGDVVGTVDPNVTCVAVPAPDQSGVIVYFCTEDDED